MELKRRHAIMTGAAALVAGLTASEAGATTSTRSVPSNASLARSLGFRSAYANVNGTRLHYVVGGSGEPLILLPGWPQTWWQYHKIMPALARKYRVFVVDLRGMGASAKPETGYDKKTLAADIHALIGHLGYQTVNLAGHDIGGMAAHSLAFNNEAALRKLAILDVGHPDSSFYDFSIIPRPGQFFFPWWFAFNQVQGLPEQLVTGRARYLLDWLLSTLLINPAAVNELDRTVYAAAYDYPDAIRAGNGWYQTFTQDIIDEETYGQINLPVLALASEFNDGLEAGMKRKATDVQFIKVTGSGHLLAEEQPAAVTNALTTFFG